MVRRLAMRATDRLPSCATKLDTGLTVSEFWSVVHLGFLEEEIDTSLSKKIKLLEANGEATSKIQKVI